VFSGIQYIVGSPLLLAGDVESSNFSVIEDYRETGKRALQVGSDTYVLFKSSDSFTIEVDDVSTSVFGIYVNPYESDYVKLAEIRSDDGTQIRTLKHVGFVAGLVPDGDALAPDGESLAPSFGQYGHFEYTVNGVAYTAQNSELPLHKYIVVMKQDSFAIFEFLVGGEE